MRFPASSSAACPPPASRLPSPTYGLPSPFSLPPSPGRAGTRARARGFTLVELLIGATLSAAVLAGVLSSYLYLSRQLARLTHQQTLETEGRRALGYFTQDVQRASGLTDTANLSASRVSLSVPAATGTNHTITYFYNSGTTATSVTINGTSISMPAKTLTRCVFNGSTVTSQTLLRYITSLTFAYYDSSGNVYTNYTDYLPGIKQLTLAFTTQTGVAASGTQTPVHRVMSSRLALRNRTFLQ